MVSGRFERTQTVMERYLSKVDRSSGPDACWPWTGGTFDSGYGRLTLDDARRSSIRSHRWGYEALVGPIPPGMIVRHTCDNRACHNPAHWLLGTFAENSADMTARGRSARGTRNAAAKLTEADVIEIRRLAAGTARGKGRTRRGQVTLKSIADQFGVTAPVVRQIRDGIRWTHVSELGE